MIQVADGDCAVYAFSLVAHTGWTQPEGATFGAQPDGDKWQLGGQQ